MGARRGSLSFTRFRVKGDVPKDLRRKFLDAARLRLFTPLDVSDEAMEGKRVVCPRTPLRSRGA